MDWTGTAMSDYWPDRERFSGDLVKHGNMVEFGEGLIRFSYGKRVVVYQVDDYDMPTDRYTARKIRDNADE